MPRRVSPVASSAASARRPALKSPLRTATMSLGLPAAGPGSPVPEVAAPAPVTAQQVRLMQVSEFAAWLRTQTSPKTKRPYEEKTVSLYCQAAGPCMPG